METTSDAVEQDPLGLKRFALTESAYDLVNTIRGTYGRLSHAESQKANSDQALINHWRNRSREVGRAYRRLNGDNLLAIDEFTKTVTAEWHQIAKVENERSLRLSHAS